MAERTAMDSCRKAWTVLPILGEVDGRTLPARRFKALAEQLIEDMGGEEMVSAAQLELIKRSAGIGVLAQQVETRIIAGERIDAMEYVNLTQAHSRLLRTIGLERRQRDVTLLDGAD